MNWSLMIMCAFISGGLCVGSSEVDPGDGSIGIDGQFKSTLATGTRPINVVSTTMCANLNADMVDGKHSADLVLATQL
jgi:hypothetical protein